MNTQTRIQLISVPAALVLPGAARATSIRSIAPTVADRGELVKITGGGFGARNLEVTVGGDPVELVSATGSWTSFHVPALGRVGEVVVEARIPGGHVGRIGLRGVACGT